MANAHQDPDSDGMRIFDRGYLVGVSGFIIAFIALPLTKYSVQGIGIIDLCQGKEGQIVRSLVLIEIGMDSFHFISYKSPK